MALGKKVKTLLLDWSGAISAGTDAAVDGADSHTFQDDVRVIGVEVGTNTQWPDGALNADQEREQIAEVSKHGQFGHDGALARVILGASWTAALVVSSGPGGAAAPVMFPEGHGVDFDDGETIYLHTHQHTVGTVDVLFGAWAIIYYVER